jgi:hypothetical protein
VTVLARAQASLLHFLRVPPRPQPPAGAAGSVRVFQAAPNFYRYQLVQWGLKQLGALWGLGFGLYGLQFVPAFPWDGWLRVAEAVGVASFAAQLPVTLLGVRLDFRLRWYLVTDRSLRVREGIVRVREQTMSFANIQNLAVRQGPLQRLLGIADLEVRTAGGGDGGGKGHEHRERRSLHLAYFRGVDNAEEIKGLILDRLRRLRGSGLGDPEESEAEAPSTPAPGGPALAAAHDLLAEARALRRALAGPESVG